MPDLKISQLTNGNPAQSGDLIPIDRAGANFSLTAASIAALAAGTVTSVSFTGGLISVATPTTTPAFTVAGTSGGIPYFSSTSAWGSSALLTANSPVLGGGAGAAPFTATFLTTDGAATLTIGVAAGGNGVLALSGTTSGAATFTAPAVAGTTTNPVVSSNAISVPAGSTTLGGLQLGNTQSIGSAAGVIRLISGNTSNAVTEFRNLSGTLQAQIAGIATYGAIIASQVAQTGFGVVGDISSSVTVLNATSGNQIGVSFGSADANAALNFAPTSGTATLDAVLANPTINQTGGANGNVNVIASYPVVTAAGGTVFLFSGGTSSALGNAGTKTIKFTVDSAGNVVASGNYTSGAGAGVSAGPFTAVTSITTVGGIVTVLSGTSDERLKTAVPYAGGLAEILAITPVRYTWNAKGVEQTGLSGTQEFVGFIAQDVQRSIPEAITGTEKSKDGTETYLSLDDRPIVAALVAAVKELAAQIAELKKK